MAKVVLDGIETRYEVVGSGSPILMFAPGGFDATIEKWSTQGVYAKIKPVDNLSKHHTLIMFDRRECGQSGGRVERVTYAHYVRQAVALLDHLGIEKAHMMGGCMGCSPVALMGVMHPERVSRGAANTWALPGIERAGGVDSGWMRMFRNARVWVERQRQ